MKSLLETLALIPSLESEAWPKANLPTAGWIVRLDVIRDISAFLAKSDSKFSESSYAIACIDSQLNLRPCEV